MSTHALVPPSWHLALGAAALFACDAGLADLADPGDPGPAGLATRATAPTAPAWMVTPTPNLPGGTFGSLLQGVASTSGSAAWAVGYQSVGMPLYQTRGLIEHWNGSAWSVVQSAHLSLPGYTSEQLTDVRAADAAHLWAVGYAEDPNCICQKTLTEHFTGLAWRLVSSPSPGVASSLAAMSLVSDSSVWAVGGSWITGGGGTFLYPLAMHWNGTAWSVIATPAILNSNLLAVAAVSDKDVWAIGVQYSDPLALHYNGTSWTQVAFPNEEGSTGTVVRSMSAVATNDIWAAGFIDVPAGFEGGDTALPRTWHWNGANWQIVDSPFGFAGLAQGAWLVSIQARASNDVWAAGIGAPSTMHWDGTAWTNSTDPSTGYPYAIDASPAGDVWAVGQADDINRPFVLHRSAH